MHPVFAEFVHNCQSDIQKNDNESWMIANALRQTIFKKYESGLGKNRQLRSGLSVAAVTFGIEIRIK